MVTRIDRLARSLKDLQDIVHELKTMGVTLEATEQLVDTGSASGLFSTTPAVSLLSVVVRSSVQVGGVATRP